MSITFDLLLLIIINNATATKYLKFAIFAILTI